MTPVQTFGRRERGRSYRLRAAAYVVILDESLLVACIVDKARLIRRSIRLLPRVSPMGGPADPEPIARVTADSALASG
jgi:hypothetical protein